MSPRIRTRSRKTAEPAKPLYVWWNPGTVIDRNGFPVDTKGEIWRLNDISRARRLNWDLSDTATDIKDSMKAYAVHSIESQGPLTIGCIAQGLRHFLSIAGRLESLQHLNYSVLEAALTKMRLLGTAHKFSAVRRWYRWCTDQGLPGFQEEITTRLNRIKLPRLEAGLAVMSRDLTKGPLDDQEHWLVRQAITAGEGDLLERVCVMMVLETGSRPSQLVLLKKQDFQVQQAPSGEAFYSLDIARMKQRTVNGHDRKRRRISPELGMAIHQLMASNHQQYGDRGPQMPLLCTIKCLKRRAVPEPLKAQYGLHLSAQALSRRLKRFALAAKIISPRTGKLLKLSALRLRHTFGTRHAEQGTPAKLIAELLDHSRLCSVMVYIKSTSNTVDRLNKALGDNDRFTGMIRHFLGRIQPRTGVEASQNIIPGCTPTLKNLGGIGICGAGFLCQLYPPLSCYVCPKFIAWVDGPHQRMLEELRLHAQELRERSGNPSDRIPQQLEEVIAAVEAVLERIKSCPKESHAPHQQNA